MSTLEHVVWALFVIGLIAFAGWRLWKYFHDKRKVP